MRVVQTSQVMADVTSSDRRRRGVPSPHATRGSRRATPRARRVRAGYRPGPARFVTGVAVIVALTTAAFGIEAYVRSGHEQRRITALEGKLTGLQQRLATDEHAAAGDRRHVGRVAAQTTAARRALARLNWALQSVPSEAQMAGVRNEFAAYAACIPQLQREIAGLSVNWKVNPGKAAINLLKLSTTAPISASCASALTGR
jgi:hypothetical protein